jgi:hypothetical protein
MKIKRGPRKERGFVIIDNALAQDSALSFGARGLGTYLLSLPTGARVDIRTLAARNPEGRAAIAGYMRELEEACYLVRTSQQGADGRFGTTSTMHEERQDPGALPESLPKPWSKAKERQAVRLSAVPDQRGEGEFSQVTPNPVKPAFGPPGPGGPASGDAGVNPYGVKEPEERTSSSPARDEGTTSAGHGGGGGDAPQGEEQRRAVAFVDSLPYRGRIPGPKQHRHLTEGVAAAFAAGWEEAALRRQLTADTENAKSMSAVFRYRLEPGNLPATTALPVPGAAVSDCQVRPVCPECDRPLASGSEAKLCRDCRTDQAG